MAEALRAAEREAGEPVCYVISGDLAHVGPKFNDPEPVTPAQLDHGRARDRALLAAAAQADADGFFREVAGEGDARRICGLPPAWVALTAAAPSSGRVLHYQQYVHPQGQESVSFAAAVFEP
jgi:AmmeMemoRadiSam system protein B